jgi:LPS export ABC transporter protein LptC
MIAGNTRRLAWELLWVGLPVLLACNPPEIAPPERGGDTLRTTQQSKHIRVTETLLGKRRWVLEAEEAVGREDTGISVLRSVRVTFYDEDGAVASTLTSNEGEAEGKTRHLVARDSVVVETPDGERLETELLEWDNTKKKIQTDAPVRILQGENMYTGVGLVSDADLEHFEILKDVRGTVRGEDQPLDEWRRGRP